MRRVPKEEKLTAIPMPRICVAGTRSARSNVRDSAARSDAASVKLLSVTLRLMLSHGPWPRNLIGSGALLFLRFILIAMHFPFTPASTIRLCTSPTQQRCLTPPLIPASAVILCASCVICTLVDFR